MWAPIWHVSLITHCLRITTPQQRGRQKQGAGVAFALLPKQLLSCIETKDGVADGESTWSMHGHYGWWRFTEKGCDIPCYYRCHTARLHHPVSKEECQLSSATPKTTTFAQRCEKLCVNHNRPVLFRQFDIPGECESFCLFIYLFFTFFRII